MNELFLNYLKTLPLETLVPLWNAFAVDELPDCYIWDNVEAYIKSEDAHAIDIARMVHFGWVYNWEDRVYLDWFGNFRSFNTLQSSPIDLEELADWLEETQHKVFLNWQNQDE